MPRVNKKLFYIIILFVLSFFVAGCADNSETVLEQGLPRLERNKVLRIGILADKFGILHPFFPYGQNTEEILGALFRPLWDFNDSWHPIPVLIKEIPSSDGTSYGTRTITKFRLKESLRWSNGTPLISNIFLMEELAVLNPEFKDLFINKETTKRVLGMKAEDPYILEIKWKKPLIFPFLGYPYPVHEDLLKPIFQGKPREEYLKEFERNPVSNGPFKLLSWKQDTGGIVIQNEHYTGENTEFKRLVFMIYHREEDLFSAIKDKKIDIAVNVTPSLAKETANMQSYRVYSIPSPVGIGVWINLNNSWLSSKELRQALLLSLQREDIAKELFRGYGTLAESWLSPKHPLFYPVVTQEEFKENKIRFFLTEAGWEIGEKQILVRTAKGGTTFQTKGEELVLAFALPEGDIHAENMATILENKWKKIGVVLRRNYIPSQEYNEFLLQRKFSALAYGKVEWGPLVEPMEIWHSSAIPSQKNNWIGGNISGWNDPKNNTFCQATALLNNSEAKDISIMQQKRWAQEIPFIPIGWLHQIVIARKEINGLKPRGFSPTTWNVEEWKWE